MKELKVMESRQLKKDNRIVLVKYNISSFENKIYHYVLREVQIKMNIIKNDLKNLNMDEKEIENKVSNTIITCEISKAELLKLTNSHHQRERNYLKESLERLKQSEIVLQDYDESGNEKWVSANFFSAVAFEEKNNMYYIRIDPLIYISIIKSFENGNFTPIDLNNLFKLKNFHSQRLYELLRKWKFHTCYYKLQDLKEYMLGENYKKSYNNTSEFKRLILNPAIKELVEKGLYKEGLTYSQKKTGRVVTDIIFENVYDMSNRIALGNKDIQLIKERTSRLSLVDNNDSIIDTKEITIDVMESLSEISYKDLIKYFRIRIDMIDNRIFLTPLDTMGRNLYMKYEEHIIDVLKEKYINKSILEYKDKITTENLVNINNYKVKYETENDSIDYKTDIVINDMMDNNFRENDTIFLDQMDLSMFKSLAKMELAQVSYEMAIENIKKIHIHTDMVEVYVDKKFIDNFNENILKNISDILEKMDYKFKDNVKMIEI